MEHKKAIVIATSLLGGSSFLLFLWALSGMVYKSYPLALFGQVGESVNCYLLAFCFSLDLALLVFLAFLTKEKRFGFLSVPALILSLLFLFGGLAIRQDEYAYELQFSSFSDSLIIRNTRSFLSGSSVIYEKADPFRLHYLTEVWGDDGAMPLEKRESYEVKEYPNGVVFTYHDNDWEGHVYLAYDGTNFILKDSMEGFQ
jgi:hypothetical protein